MLKASTMNDVCENKPIANHLRRTTYLPKLALVRKAKEYQLVITRNIMIGKEKVRPSNTMPRPRKPR